MTALLGALLLQAPLHPAEPGVAWTWGRDPRRLQAEVWDRPVLRGRRCIRVRFWGVRRCDPWILDDLYLDEREGALFVAGYRVEEHTYLPEEPAPLLPAAPEAGRAWTARFVSGSFEAGDVRWTDAAFRIEARERVSVPAGTFDAWRIRWTDKDDDREGYRWWLAPGVGIVRIESLSAKNDATPWTLDLTKADPDRPARFTRYPALDEARRASIGARLEALADPARRAAAEQALRDLGPGVVPLLRPRLDEGDAEVRAALGAVVRSFARVRVEARVLRAACAVGDPLPVEFRIVNEGPEPTLVLPCLADAIQNMGRKFPAIAVEVRDEAGREPSLPIAGSFWSAPPLRGRQFRRLLPGESLDLFAEGEGGLPGVLAAGPGAPGRYTVRLVLDVRGAGAEDWATDAGPPDDEARALLPQLVRGRFASEPVVITVSEKAK